MIISAIKPEVVGEAWGAIRKHVISALEFDQDNLTEAKVLYNVMIGKWVLLVAVENETILGVQTIELVNKGDKGILCNLVTTGGANLELWQDDMIDAIKQVAIEQKCYAIHTRGRIGWLKKLKRNGFKPLYFIAELKL